jgi:Xaa-Pro dipeptidase
MEAQPMKNRISTGEFQQRVQNIRGEMKKRNLDVLFIYSQKRGHVTYVSGYRPNYHTHSAVIVLPLERDPIMWIKFAFDLPRARSISWIDDIRPSKSESTTKMFAGCAEEIRSLGFERARVGLVASDLAVDEMGVTLFDALRSTLPHAQFESASDLMNEIRLIKSAEEIAALRDSAQLADLVAAALAKEIRPGQTERLAVVRAAQAARLEGGECDVIISSDVSRISYPPLDYEFRQGCVVNCEITVQLAGYWVQICRVFSLGAPSAEQREVFAVAHGAYSAGVKASVPGARVSDVFEASNRVIKASGLKNFAEFGPGHGVGLDLPELYGIDHESQAQLAPGVILVVHPGIWVAGKGAAFVGGPIAVTESGNIHLDSPQSEIFEV